MTTKDYEGAFFEIYNGTGSSLTYMGTTYKNTAYVPIKEILQGSYSLQRAKLWGSDAGRSMTGVYSGTLLGIFPKVTFKVGRNKLDYESIASLSMLIDQSTANCYYWDSANGMVLQEFYFDDLTPTAVKIQVNSKKELLRYDALEVVAVATKKLS